jgi:hypothetical protein
MKKKIMLAVALAASMAEASSASAHLVQIRGGVTCAAWTQQRPKNSNMHET